MNTDDFQELLYRQASELYRPMPWRDDTRPYYVLVSELMLQQTQVERVVPKFAQFIAAFPDERALADAPLSQVLSLWSGLGYNRRAKYLQQAAQLVVTEFDGVFPESEAQLQRLPGVGPNTAGAIRAYAFNLPAIFVETNIRTVYFRHFFAGTDKVSDAAVRAKLAATLDRDNPRRFYWALMDYGSYLKRQGAGAISRSHHYRRQSPLKGSVRQVRGQIVRLLAKRSLSKNELAAMFAGDVRLQPALDGLIADGLITQDGDTWRLAS